MVKMAKNAGVDAVIPSRVRKQSPREYDKDLYKESNLIERMFSKLKHLKRVVIGYDKIDISYLIFVFIAAIYLWLK